MKLTDAIFGRQENLRRKVNKGGSGTDVPNATNDIYGKVKGNPAEHYGIVADNGILHLNNVDELIVRVKGAEDTATSNAKELINSRTPFNSSTPETSLNNRLTYDFNFIEQRINNDFNFFDKNKLDKTDDVRSVYVNASNGNPAMIQYNQTATSGSIVQRDANANIEIAQNPTALNHATSKDYVDNLLNNKSDLIYMHSVKFSFLGGGDSAVPAVFINAQSSEFTDRDVKALLNRLGNTSNENLYPFTSIDMNLSFLTVGIYYDVDNDVLKSYGLNQATAGVIEVNISFNRDTVIMIGD